ncbi:SAM-dependent methyltransferase [Micromonospora chalcea]
MSTRELTDIDEVAEIYDDGAWAVEVLGGNIHFGWWEDDDDRTPFLEAINRFTDIVGDRLALRPGERLLDVGCGAGEPAIRLGQRSDADITGITNSTEHLKRARERVNESGLRGQVRFELGDAAALSYPDASFDKVLAFESLVHAQDRRQWLAEIRRVLKPGGRLVLTDLAEDAPLTERDRQILTDFTLAPPGPPMAAFDLVRDAGFVVDEFLSCGDKISRSFPAYHERVQQRRETLVAAHGAEKIDAFLAEMPAVLDVLRTKVGCVVIAAHKPR